MSSAGKNVRFNISIFIIGAFLWAGVLPSLANPNDPAESWYDNPGSMAGQKVTVFQEIAVANTTQNDPTNHWYFSGTPHGMKEGETPVSTASTLKGRDFQGDPTQSWYDNPALLNGRE